MQKIKEAVMWRCRAFKAAVFTVLCGRGDMCILHAAAKILIYITYKLFKNGVVRLLFLSKCSKI